MSTLQVAASRIQSDMDQIGVWRQPYSAFEQSYELEARESGDAREHVESEILFVSGVHELDNSIGDHAVGATAFGPTLIESVKAFAGQKPDVAFVEPEGRAALSSFDEFARHYEIAYHGA